MPPARFRRSPLVRVVYNSFQGRYSDNPRAIYEWLLQNRPGIEHIWFVDPQHGHGFPAGVTSVVAGSEECRAALESADLIIANTHIEVEWTKKSGSNLSADLARHAPEADPQRRALCAAGPAG